MEKSPNFLKSLENMSLEGMEYHQKAEEEAETREEMILSLRYRDEREKLCEFSPPLV